MQEQSPPMLAAIDVGSNTIHIVVARCFPDTLDIVDDQVEMVRIGKSVTATGEISAEKCDAALTVLRQYKALAEQHGAEQVFVVATEAIRQARNSAEFLAHVQQETGLQVQIISGAAEAKLTFLGATYETAREPGAPDALGVVDLGGGSMEMVTSQHMAITWHTSIPIGSGWLYDRYLPTNPPTYDDIQVATTFLRTYLHGIKIKKYPSALIVTGGSANSLLLMAQQAFRLDPRRPLLTYENFVHCEGLLSALSAEEIAKRYGQPLERARVLPAGALIIRMVMSRLGLDEIRVSAHGIREGVLLAYMRSGQQWLEYAEREHDESFAESGRRMLQERLEKMLEWRDEVLKHEDIEAVHRMRVASRRLRATLDAFESCCKQKPFKQVYRSVKKTADVLGSARDTDVMLQGLRERLAQVPEDEQAGMQWLIERVTTYRQQRQQDLERFFQSFDEDALKQEIKACIPKGMDNGEG